MQDAKAGEDAHSLYTCSLDSSRLLQSLRHIAQFIKPRNFYKTEEIF